MRNPNCTDCTLCENTKTICLWGEGPENADVMIIGRSPDGNADVLGKPIAGRDSAVLDQLCEQGGIDRSKVYISNVIKCRTPDGRAPSKEEKAACFQYMKAEINSVNPKMIVVLGGDALETITGQDKIMRLAGSVIDVDSSTLDWKGKVYATVHPSYLRHNASYVPRAEKHFRDIGYFFRGEEPPKKVTNYKYITKFAEIDALFARMHTQTVITFDLETDSLDFVTGSILCFSFSWKEGTGVVLPLVGYLKEEIWTPEEKNYIIEQAKLVFANKNITWVAHNMSFDHKYIMKYGIDIAGPMGDTMLLQHALDENAKDTKGLKALAVAYTDMGRYDDGLDLFKHELKTTKSKELSDKKKAVKDNIKLVEKVLAKDSTDIAAQTDLERLQTDLQVLDAISIDISYDQIPTEILWPYAAMDADATLRIYNHHIKELRKQSHYYSSHPGNPMLPKHNLERLYFRLIMPLRRVLDEMEFRGARMDIKYLHELDKKYTKKISELRTALNILPQIKEVEDVLLAQSQTAAEEKYKTLKSTKVWEEYQATGNYVTVKPPRPPKFPDAKAYGLHYRKAIPFNMDSSNHVRILLFTVILKGKIPFGAKLTKKGDSLSVDREVLELYEDKPGIDLLMANRKVAKLYKTYVLGSLAQLGATRTDRIHTNFNQHITVTGRLSSSSPNLQNIPREDKDIKKAFIPKDGWCILQLDYSQAEFRMWAQLANDTDMFADIEAGLDIHNQTASDFWSIPMEEVTKEQRTAAKFVVFGLMYGRGSKSVAKQVGITEGAADTIKDSFFNRYPKASKWLDDTKRNVKRNLFIPGHFGRIRRLPYATSGDREKAAEAQRQSVNSPIQGSAADMTGIALIKIRRALLKTGLGEHARLILTVHDSIILEVEKAFINRVSDMCKSCMIADLPGIREDLMDADAEVGLNWGEVGDLKDNHFEEHGTGYEKEGARTFGKTYVS